jgi:predicted P-loop ATPase
MKSDKARSIWAPILPVPGGTPEAKVRHGTRGEPLRSFEYLDQDGQLLGYVARFMTSSGEAVHLPLTWCVDQDGMRGWRWIQFPRYRPLYGLETLGDAGKEFGFVLVVFDEHEAFWARKLFEWAGGGVAVVSWPGGMRKIDEVDWSPLKGRKVSIWPTLTRERAKVRRDDVVGGAILPRERQPGWQAALKIEKILLGFGCGVLSIVDFFADDQLPEGYGAAFVALKEWGTETLALAAGADARKAFGEKFFGELMDFSGKGLGTEFQQRIRKLRGERSDADPLPEAEEPVSLGASWEFRLLKKHGDLVPCLANVHDILANAEEWKGVVAFDEFAQRVVKLKPPPFHGGATGEWESTDDSRTAMWLSRTYSFTPSSVLVCEAIEVIARENGFHPPRLWLRALTWDGIPRLDDWASDYLSVPKTEYSMRVSRWFLMGMVARVMKPGAKFDYCLVLEGTQGRMKSSALAVLGGEWFSDSDINLDNKDSMSALRGKMLHEFQELGSLAKHESSKQKSFISRRIDEYRPVYGRREIRCPRQVVFAGTTNEWEWNKDPTGGRRFWPLGVDHDVNIEGLRSVRDQLFAEALVRFEKGERFWPTSDEQREIFDPEQLKREQQDSLVDLLHDWVYGRTMEFSLAMAACDGLNLDASKLTRDLQTRVGNSLRKLGCKKVERRNGMIRFWYKPPEKTAKSTSNKPAQQNGEEENVPF